MKPPLADGPTEQGGEAIPALPFADRYRIEHLSRHGYTAPVSQSWQRARMTPRALPWQRLTAHLLQIDPPPDERHEGLDSFGNHVTHFGLHTSHRRLQVRLQCEVEVGPRPALPQTAGPAWTEVRDRLRHEPAHLDAALVSVPTPMLPLSQAAIDYARPSFTPGRCWLAAVTELMHRIHADFRFKAGVTTVSTSVDQVLAQRSGVCQDFAHVMLSCLHGLGLAGRYMSGYLLTDPPPGRPRLMGVDASHAWVAAYAPGHGWIEFDPTNDHVADTRYITLAWGADHADVVPLRGVILGGGTQSLDVRVSVMPQG